MLKYVVNGVIWKLVELINPHKTHTMVDMSRTLYLCISMLFWRCVISNISENHSKNYIRVYSTSQNPPRTIFSKSYSTMCFKPYIYILTFPIQTTSILSKIYQYIPILSIYFRLLSKDIGFM